MCLFQQNQLECIKNVKPKCRKGFANATGGLCRILKKEGDYSSMLNYFVLIKDLQYIDDEKHSAIVADMASTEHDTYRFGDFFRLLKRDYEILYKKD